MGKKTWNTLYSYTGDNPGIKKGCYVITDFAMDYETSVMKFCMAQPELNEKRIDVSKEKYLLTEEELDSLFQPLEQTFLTLEKEMLNKEGTVELGRMNQ